ncbi:DUF4232 domain-containing protein [Streptomyces sp. NPDC048659]|uniref:DUF4232 domain-containing protein n=1 Tax=Streptomyces sp. NPDC048659 TaxID=3155489 RepID=UPI003420EBD1
MSTVRGTVRRTVPATSIAATVAAAASAALLLTACGPSESAGPTAASAPPETPATTAAPAPKPRPTTAPPELPADPDVGVYPCGTYDLTFTASLAERTTGSYLLKITNRSGKPCRVLGHPLVAFGPLFGPAILRGTAPSPEESLRLDPGGSAYAGLLGGPRTGKGGATVDSVAMTMDTESGLAQKPPKEQKPLTASTPGLRVSPGKTAVTPWTDDAEDALTL